MNHLVLAVSKDSSLDLLAKYADVIVLDKDALPANLKPYTFLYIRSHFSTPELQPQRFRVETEQLIKQARTQNPSITFVDGMGTIDEIIAFEDKWRQYEIYSEYMPTTKLLSSIGGTSDFTRPIYKQRLSSRGAGVTWNVEEVKGEPDTWIVQESLAIGEEVRVYVIKGEVYPIGAIRHSMSADQKTQAYDSRRLNNDEIQFATSIAKKVPTLDMIGLDIARTTDGKLFLMEVNRSPGFGAFEKLTGANLADFLYKMPH